MQPQVLDVEPDVREPWNIMPSETSQTQGFPGGAVVKNCLPMQGTQVRAPVQEDPTC